MISLGELNFLKIKAYYLFHLDIRDTPHQNNATVGIVQLSENP